ncbi:MULTISPECIES: thioredoxin family protein [Flavobacteriaceae]|uniref:Thioredoxin family protein n=2 Tax=Flavobacteriaceae TaxID=49546 RepID=A0A4Y8APR7_9FLAO|nr:MULTISPECIES: thioredoxin family protein [Flavobacteriaceae]TEW72602.1 thioredoxin family protein [Gramella jeungdoensis]GGK54399.1 thioredoxin family protein [Lutibacter litoralis]
MSKVIKILGTGCPSCISTEKVVTEVVNELNIDAKIVKVTEIMDIMAYDVMRTPAVVIDNKVMIKGKVPSKNELKALLVDNFANNACCSDEVSGSSCCSTDESETGCC